MTENDRPWLWQFDTTQDYKGTLYAQGNWKSMHKKLLKKLENHFGSSFKDNENSFSSCFQFEEIVGNGKIKRKFKVYNKMNSLLQSKSAKSSIGMNTNKLYSTSYVQS